MTQEDLGTDRTQPDLATLSRFAMTTGTLLLVYVIGGGIVDKQWTSSLIPLKVTHPEFLVWLYCGVSIYAAWRYWYYAIEIPLTRTKIRHYLQSKESILVFNGIDDGELNSSLTEPEIRDAKHAHRRNLIRGLDEKDAMLFTGVEQKDWSVEQVKSTVAAACTKYFPSLDSSQIRVSEPVMKYPHLFCWVSVSPSSPGTVIRCKLEDADLWAPVFLNVLGLVLFFFSYFFCWPSALCVLGGK